MHKTNLIQLLKVTNSEEIKGLLIHLKSQNNIANKSLIDLLNYVRKYAPNYESPKLQKAKVMAHLFKTAQGNKQKLNKIAYNLKVALQDFLITYDVEQDKVLKQQLLLQALKKRNHPDYFKQSKKLIVVAEEIWEKELDNNHLLTLFQLNYTVWSDVNTQKFRATTRTLYAANQHLDLYYWLNKLKIIIEYRAIQNLIPAEFQIKYKETLHFIQQNSLLTKNPTINLYLKALTLIESSKETAYIQLKEAFFDTIQVISKKDARDIFVTINNYFGQHIHQKTAFFAQEGLNLFEFADKHDFLIENGRIRDIEFNNAATYGAFLQQKTWTFSFVDKYEPFLAPTIRIATVALAKAQIYFKTTDYHQVLDLLRPIELQNNLTISTNIKIRTLKIRASFELWEQGYYSAPEEKEYLNHLNNLFDRFILSHTQINSAKKEGYQQFTQFMRQIINLKGTNTKQLKKLRLIKQALVNQSVISLKNWLLSKVNNRIINLSLQVVEQK